MKKSPQDWHRRFIATAAALGMVVANVGAASAEHLSPGKITANAGHVLANDPAHPAPGTNCAPINNVPKIPAFKVWNDFRASLKNAPTINGDLSRLGAAGRWVCMVDPSTPNPDPNYNANAMYGWLGTVVVYGFWTHQIIVDSALPSAFNPAHYPDGLKTLPQQIAKSLPFALNDALMNVQYGTTFTSFAGVGDGFTAATTPEATVNQVRVESALEVIMLTRMDYELAQGGYGFNYSLAKKFLPDFITAFESKYVNAPASQSTSDRLWAVFQAAMQDKNQQLSTLRDEQNFLTTYKQDLGTKPLPPKDFTQTYNPTSDINIVNDSASYLQKHAGELKDMMLSFASPPNDPALRAAIKDVQAIFASIENHHPRSPTAGDTALAAIPVWAVKPTLV